jgi:hypothetical protein
MGKDSAVKLSMEDEVNNLKKHMGAVLMTVKDLKGTIKVLEKRISNKENDVEKKSEKENCVKEILEKQKMIDKTISQNSDSIKILDQEIKGILVDKNKKDVSKQEIDDAINKLNQEILLIKRLETESNSTTEKMEVVDKIKKRAKCKYYNAGYCKYKVKCKFTHPAEVCKNYVEDKCEDSRCPNRHPKACKWFTGTTGCRRKESCDFSHDTHVCGDAIENEHKIYKCAGCKHTWNERRFVKSHIISSMELHFCLNCDDWIKQKEKVLDQGWSLFDHDGNLNHFV